MAIIAVLARSKRSKRVHSAHLTQKLRDMGHDAFRVTPRAVPRRRVESYDALVNYGVGSVPHWWMRLPREVPVLNSPIMVDASVHKLRMFRFLEAANVPTVPWTTDRAYAQRWLEAGRRVAARHRLTGTRGAGIQVVHPDQELPMAPLYTRLIRGSRVREFRVLCVNGSLSVVSQKRRRTGRNYEGDDELIRNSGNGWVYAFNNVELPERALYKLEAVAGVLHTAGMGLVGLDVLANIDTGRYWVLETNTAPSLSAPTTLQRVACSIDDMVS